MMLLHVLGPVRAGNGGMESSFGSAMVRGLALRLALSANRRVTRMNLIEALWDRAPAPAEANLRVYASALRRDLAWLRGNAPADRRSPHGDRAITGFSMSFHPPHLGRADASPCTPPTASS